MPTDPRRLTSPDAVLVPLGYPSAMFFVDESGSKASAGQYFVVAAAKLRSPGLFQRAIRDVRDRTGFEGEFKFSEITKGTLVPYYELIDQLEQSDARLAACVVDGDTGVNPFADGGPAWIAHADVVAQLLVGNINRRELVTVVLDGISTPRGCSLEDHVRQQVNRRLRNSSVVGAICLDSRSNDCVQVADLIAGAVAFGRRRDAGRSGNATSPKGKVASRLQAAFSLANFGDQRSDRVNIATYRGRGSEQRAVRLVKESRPRG